MNQGATSARQIDALTGIRILPAILVVVYHYGTACFPMNVSPLKEILTGANTAVSFFFFLSGFILAHVYSPQMQAKTFVVRTFVLARVARIYPVYLLALLLQVLYFSLSIYWDRISVIYSALDIQPHLVLMQAWLPGNVLHWNAPGWSLSAELFFYLTFPLLLRSILNRLRVVWLGSALLLYLLMYGVVEPLRLWVWKDYLAADKQIHDFLLYYPVFHWTTFALGACTFFLVRQRNPVRPIPGFVLSFALGAALVLMGWLLFWTDGTRFVPLLIHNGFLAPFYGVIVGSIYLGEPISRRILGHPFMVLLGEASYSVYILQVPVFCWLGWAVGPWASSSVVHFCVYLGVLIAVSVMAFRCVEKPARSWLRKRFAA